MSHYGKFCKPMQSHIVIDVAIDVEKVYISQFNETAAE